jgi:hypothetical protein
MTARHRSSLASVFVVAAVIAVHVSFTSVGDSRFEPVLHKDDLVLTERITYRLRLPYRGELVTIADGHDLHQVVGIGGDTVARLYDKPGLYKYTLNGAALWTVTEFTRPASANLELRVPAGHVAVVPFHRPGFGTTSVGTRADPTVVPVDQLQGRALFILWPVSRRGWLLGSGKVNRVGVTSPHVRPTRLTSAASSGLGAPWLLGSDPLQDVRRLDVARFIE